MTMLAVTPSVTPFDTPAVTPSVTPSDTPAITPAVTPSGTPAVTPAVTPFGTPSVTHSPSPTALTTPTNKSVSSTLTLALESSAGIVAHNTSKKISLVGPLIGAFGALVGICAAFLLYRWHKQQRRQQVHTLHPEPFDSTVTGVDRSPEKVAVGRGSLQKIAGESATEGSDGNLNTSNLPSSTFVTVPSSQLEETQRELRELREIVFVLRAANNDNVHAALDTESVDTGFTPPPDYATERGSFMPIIQNGAV
ncbi:hypothetical protein D9619_013205 [Psilocybe cf. subviscida]|uniref:Uncharacterized protein n=1 Tax=Psilocybe cf. subviscida TaxID=2480587 RepID=A0A8H5EYY2_9AGAR|nr:hypothetical protein D9619_013205 [Psilocybe cf. subviscida]